MNQALTPPNTSSLVKVVGLDWVIRTIQSELSDLDWLRESLGRVVPQLRDDGKSEPWIYKGNGEYYTAFPNDTLPSFSCIYAHDDERTIEQGTFRLRTVSIIVCVNFKSLQIEPPTLEGLKQDTIDRLAELECVSSVDKTFDQTAVGANGIYPDMDISALRVKYLKWPYGAFRVQTTIHWIPHVC